MANKRLRCKQTSQIWPTDVSNVANKRLKCQKTSHMWSRAKCQQTSQNVEQSQTLTNVSNVEQVQSRGAAVIEARKLSSVCLHPLFMSVFLLTASRFLSVFLLSTPPFLSVFLSTLTPFLSVFLLSVPRTGYFWRGFPCPRYVIGHRCAQALLGLPTSLTLLWSRVIKSISHRWPPLRGGICMGVD